MDEQTIFHDALGRRDPRERAAYLDEACGLDEGLRRAVEAGVDELTVVSDSELIVRQMRGEYRVKNRALRALSLEAAALARQIGRVDYTAVRREHNELADRLVNEALDRASST